MKKRSLQFDPDTESRQNRQERIQQVQTLLHRAQLLETAERELIEMVFERSSTFEQIARLTGQSASSVNRRFRTLTGKLIAKEYLMILAKDKRLSTLELSIGREYFICGHSQKRICRKLGCSRYRVQKVIKTMRQLIYEDNQSK